MILTCESCHTQFSVPSEALLPSGRRVKCSRCTHTWFQKPEGAENAPVVEAAVAEAIAEAAATPAPATEPLEQPKPKRTAVVVTPAPRVAGPAIKLPAVAMLLIGAILQATLALHYLGLGGNLLNGIGLNDVSVYELQSVSFEKKPLGGDKFVLALNGSVKNTGALTAPTPAIYITLFDMHQRVVSELAFKFPTPQLQPGETAVFQPKINNIPASITHATLDLGNSLERSLR